MTVRYTAVASMPEAAPRDFDAEPERERDIERWRDKLELRLDNRQVFFLFFGSAVVACMLFILGVMVGKRIESRGQAEAATPQDPLAALDRAHEPAAGAAAAAAEPELSFPNTLIGGRGGKPNAAKVKAMAMAAAPKAPAPVAVPKPMVAAAPAAPAFKAPPAASAPKILASAAAPKPLASAPKLPAAAPKPLLTAPATAASKSTQMTATPKAVVAAAPPKSTAAAATDAAKTKGKFTLHLSTFTTAQDASAFAEKFPGAFVVAADPSGKGGTFRVRYGNFASYKEATAAKESFEKQHNLIALVAAR